MINLPNHQTGFRNASLSGHFVPTKFRRSQQLLPVWGAGSECALLAKQFGHSQGRRDADTFTWVLHTHVAVHRAPLQEHRVLHTGCLLESSRKRKFLLTVRGPRHGWGWVPDNVWVHTYQPDAETCWYRSSKAGREYHKAPACVWDLCACDHTAPNTTASTQSTNTRHQREQWELKNRRQKQPGGDARISGRGTIPQFHVFCSKLDLNPAARPLGSAALRWGRSHALERLQTDL